MSNTFLFLALRLKYMIRLRVHILQYFKSRPSENSQGNTRPKVGDVGVLKDNNDVWRRVQVEFSEGGEVDLRDVDDGLLVQSLNRPLFILPPEFQTNFMVRKYLM